VGGVLVLGGIAAGGILAVYGIGRLVQVAATGADRRPYLSGNPPAEHAVSRYHVRWYTLTMLFLAFDMEMVFMYPWTLVVARVGTGAVVEMFVFLAMLFAGVLYAWREGVLRWT
jgi:NADH-quinone oxidoreductase subunit A